MKHNALFISFFNKRTQPKNIFRARFMDGDRLKRDDGSVLVVALVMLVLLTLIGISANRTSTIDIQVAGNEKVYKMNLFTAEAGASEAIQTLQDHTDLRDNPPQWVAPTPGSITDDDARTDSNWVAGPNFAGGTVPSELADSIIDNTNNTRFVVCYEGVGRRQSLAMGRQRVYSYTVYGRSTLSNGESIIRMGYMKPF